MGHLKNRRGWKWHNPVTVHFGWGTLERLPSLLGDRTAVVLTFPEAGSCGLTDRLRDLLGQRLLGIHDRIEPNPELAAVTRLYADLWEAFPEAQAIVAVGGGSVLDTAKALMGRTHSGSFHEIAENLRTGQPPRFASVIPLIAVPTTAGTGSEVTPWATLWDRSADMRKYSLHHRGCWAEAALVDPSLTLSLPTVVVRDSALDALSHALEALWNVNANPVSDALALTAAQEVLENLPPLLRDPWNRDLRNRISHASLSAGLAFSNTQTALAHSLSYDMTLRHGLSHGLACSFTLPLVWRLAAGRDPRRDQVLGQVFGPAEVDPPAALERFLNALGVATGFRDYGIGDAEWQQMVSDAVAGPRGRNFLPASSRQANFG